MTRSHNSRRGVCSRWHWDDEGKGHKHGRHLTISQDDLFDAYDAAVCVDDTEVEWTEWEDTPNWVALSEALAGLALTADGELALPIDADDESWDVASVSRHSEWTIVEVGETEWHTEIDRAPSPAASVANAAPWGLEDDSALARRLQQEEWRSLAPRPRAADKGGRRLGTLPRLGGAALSNLKAQCGACVVCGDNVALVLYEPCGHLCLCPQCLSRLEGVNATHCVMCRTPGTPTHLFRGRGGPLHDGYRVDEGVNVDFASGHLTPTGGFEELLLESREERAEDQKAGLDKLGLVRSKRALSRMGRTGCFSATLANSACNLRYRWYSTYPYFTRTAHPELRSLQPGAILEAATRKRTLTVRPNRSKVQAREASYQKRQVAAALAEHKRFRAEARRQAAEGLSAQKERLLCAVAEAEEFASAGTCCKACNERDACMLALGCGHISLCRQCWLRGVGGAEDGGDDASAGARCLECGGGCKLALQCFRA